jgi:nitroreductase
MKQKSSILKLLHVVLLCSFHKLVSGLLGYLQIKLPSKSNCKVEQKSLKLLFKNGNPEEIHANSFDDAITHRYTCSRFQKHDESSIEHQQVISDALQILDVARRAPSGFNVQPWRAVMVCSTEAKERLSHYALAHNADRIRDSDCSVVFLADKECGREMSRFGMFLQEQDQVVAKAKNRKPMSKSKVRYTQALVLLFSSGYPIPRWIGAPFSFFVRLGVAAVSVLSRRRILVPSLSSAECWASKNCMLFAMSYILGCASRNLATAPMEGFNAGGVRKVLGIPKRFAIPLIVSTGKPLQQADTISGVEGDVSVSSPKHVYTNRYPMNQVLYQDKYGQDFTIQKH